jgi:hypothetical protein
MENEKLSEQEIDYRRGRIELAGGPISLEKARSWTSNYRKVNEKTTSHFFGRKVIEKILRQKDCAGIRMHYAFDERGHKQLILSGVDHLGKDQLPNNRALLKEGIENHIFLNQAADEEQGNDNQLYDQSWPCPGTNGCPGNI